MPTHEWNENSVAEVIQDLFAEDGIRQKCLGFFVDSIDTAYVCAADRWGVTLKAHQLRLNVGKIEVFTIWPDMVHCLVDLDTIPRELWEREDVVLYGSEPDKSLGFYKSVAKSVCCNIPAAVLHEVRPLVEATHRILIENAARTGRNPMTKKSHSPEVIAYLSSYLGREIPVPAY